MRKDPKLNDARYWLAMTLFRQGRANLAAAEFDRYLSEEGTFYANYGAEWSNWTLSRLEALHDLIDQGLSVSSPEAQAELTAARQCAERLRSLAGVKLDEHCGTTLSFDPVKEARAIDAFVAALEGSADKTLVELIVAVPELEAVGPNDLSLLVARVHARLRSSKSTEVDTKGVPLVIRDGLKLPTLAGQQRNRQVVALGTGAWAQYKACNFPQAANSQASFHNLYRQMAISQYRA